jgi:hypothetical protein
MLTLLGEIEFIIVFNEFEKNVNCLFCVVSDFCRNYRPPWGYPNEGRYAPPAHSEVDERPSIPPTTPHPPNSESSSKGLRRPESPASSVSSRHLTSKRHRSRYV